MMKMISHPRVSFCGLGAMGGGMAKHLLKNKFQVTGYDVYKPLVDKLLAAGGKGAASPRAAAAEGEIFLIMVTSYSQITSALFEGTDAAVHAFPREAVILISSTVPPHYCDEVRKRLDEEFNRADIYLLDCPVSGGTPRAASGELSIFSAGPEAGLKLAFPVLDALAATLYTIPGGIGFGSKAKMCHQILPEADIALAAEAMALAARAGLNTQEVFDAVQASDGASWIVGNRVPHMLEGDQSIYSAIPNGQKDSAIIVNTSRIVSFPVYMVSMAEQVYQAGIHAGWAKDDDSTLWRLYLQGQPDNFIYQQTKTKTKSPVTAREESITIQDIADIFAGGHLAASAEALGFTEAVGLDTTVMYDIISKAAGSNVQFVECVVQMKKPTWSLEDVPSAKSVGERLARALRKGNAIGASLPMASAALQLFHLHIGSF